MPRTSNLTRAAREALATPVRAPALQRRTAARGGRARALTGVLATALAFVLLFASPAGASEVTKIFEECANGKLPSGHSQQAYSQAIKQMEPELAEYTDCPDLIHKAQLAGAAGSHGGGTGGGPGSSASITAAVEPPSPAEQRTLENIPHAGALPVHVGDEVIHPGVVHANIASALSTLPAPLLALLAFLLACAVLLAGRLLRERVRGAPARSQEGDGPESGQ